MSGNLSIMLSGAPIDGLLFIGDPHASGVCPGFRKDEDFLGSILGKLGQCAKRANQENLQAIITGDLVERGGETGNAFLLRLIETLRLFDRIPLLVPGNHDLSLGRQCHAEFSDSHAIRVLEAAGVLRILKGDATPEIEIPVAGGLCRIGGLCYGRAIPAALLWPEDKAWTVLVTHHDLAFAGYEVPGALPVPHWDNLDLLVNGHIHDALPMQRTASGGYACNPGNITRQTRADRGRHPGVLRWRPGSAPDWLPLEAVAEVFFEEDIRAVPGKAPLQTISRYAALLRDEVEKAGKTQETDNAQFVTDLKVVMAEQKLTLDQEELVWELLCAATEDTAATPSRNALAGEMR